MFLLKTPNDWNSLRRIPIKSKVTYLRPLKNISKTESPNTNKCKVWLDGVQLTNTGGTNMQQLADINGDFTIGVQIKGTNYE